MELKGKKIGVAFCGSFCTFDKVFGEIELLAKDGAKIYPIFSDAAKSIESRFGKPEEFLKRAEEISGHKPIMKIAEAEPIGPGGYLDILAIIPCTGNTAAKLANGITDTPVLMAAKAHLRNNKPLVIFISTNDGLAAGARNIGELLARKHYYFVPFGQDSAETKPCSLVADFERLPETVDAALRGEQIQPILL